MKGWEPEVNNGSKETIKNINPMFYGDIRGAFRESMWING